MILLISVANVITLHGANIVSCSELNDVLNTLSVQIH